MGTRFLLRLVTLRYVLLQSCYAFVALRGIGVYFKTDWWVYRTI